METAKKFKGSIFGYRKKDVNDYIMSAAREFEQKKINFETENSTLSERYRELEAKNSALTDKVAVLEQERSYIADALLDAKQEAEKIVADAKIEAAKIRSELELELDSLRSKVHTEQKLLHGLRSDAKEALEAYIGRLTDIDMKIGGVSMCEKDRGEEGIYSPDGEEDDDFEFVIEDIEA